MIRINRREFGMSAAAVWALRPSMTWAATGKRSIPSASDTLISLRSAAPDVSQPMAVYHPNRVEWHYVSNPDFVRTLKSRFGVSFVGGAINSSSTNPGQKGVAVGVDGGPLVAPWMRGTTMRRVSTADPATRASLLAWADRTLDAGCDGIQVDDGAFQWVGEEWGGDFSPASIAGFGPWLSTHLSSSERTKLGLAGGPGFDYRQWLTQKAGVHDSQGYVARRKTLATTPVWRQYLASSVLSFWSDLRAHLDQRSSTIPLSMNFGQVEPNEYFSALAPRLDYTVSEVQADDPSWRFALAGATAEGVGLRFAGCFSGRAPRAQLRQAIAACYASGIIPIAPWDGFVAAKGGTVGARFSPPPGDYADLFQFAKAHADLLDGFTGSANVGVLVPIDGYAGSATTALVQKLVATNVPFRILMVGGAAAPRALSAAMLAGLSQVYLVRPAASYDDATRATLKRSGVRVADGTGTPDPSSDGVGQAGQGGDWRLAVRQRGSDPASHVVHVVANRADAGPLSGPVMLRHGLPYRFEATSNWRLFRPGAAPVTINAQAAGDATRLDVPEIESWGILSRS